MNLSVLTRIPRLSGTRPTGTRLIYWHAEIGPRPSGTRLVGTTPFIQLSEQPVRQWRERKCPILETVSKGDSNPGSLDCGSGILVSTAELQRSPCINASQSPPMHHKAHQCITKPTNASQSPPMHHKAHQCITKPTNASQSPPMHHKAHQCITKSTNASQSPPMHL